MDQWKRAKQFIKHILFSTFVAWILAVFTGFIFIFLPMQHDNQNVLVGITDDLAFTYFNLNYQSDIRSNGTLVVSDLPKLAEQIAEMYSISRNIIRVFSARFIQNIILTRRKRQTTSLDHITNHKTGDLFVIDLEIKYPTTCALFKMCNGRFVDRVFSTIRLGPPEFSFNISLVNGTTYSVKLTLYSINETYVTAITSTTATGVTSEFVTNSTTVKVITSTSLISTTTSTMITTTFQTTTTTTTTTTESSTAMTTVMTETSTIATSTEIYVTTITMTTTTSTISTTTTTTSLPVNVFWPFNSNYNDLYNIYNGVGINNPTFISPGYNGYGSSLSLNRISSQYVLVPTYANMAFTSFTWEIWAYPTNFAMNDSVLVGMCESSTTNQCLSLMIRQNTIYFGFLDNDCWSTANVSLNQWHHFGFVYDYEHRIQYIYLNGIRVCTHTLSDPFQTTSGSITIGAMNNTGIITNFWTGYIDQVSYVSRDKTEDEILEDATLVAYYSFDNGSFLDYGPNKINGTGVDTRSVAGRVNEGILFNTSGSYFQSGGFTLLGYSYRSYSIALWVYRSSPATGFGTLLHTSHS
ncbi:hypothetical protein I4U23_015469 [Adineta vaga]|nr:hypothetical protein I4U23_015469 [Adineta vaga]